VTLTRDANWNLTQITSRHGRWIRLTYDTLNRITRAEDNIGRVVQYTYDSIGRLETVTDVANGVTTFTYDAQHRMRTIRDPRNIVYLTNDYDANGRVILQTQADSTTYQFAYTLGADGKVVQTDVTNPRGFVRRVTFNGSGYPLTDSRALGTPEAQTMTYLRQPGTNLPLSVTDALNRKTSYTYDSLGNALTVTRLADTPDAVTTTFTYEPVFSQVATVTDPLNHTTTLNYDAKGNLLSTADANGNTVTTSYDALGRPVAITDGAGNRTQLVYSGPDLQTVINPVGDTVTRAHDGIGRVSSVTDGRGFTTQYEFNAFSQVTRLVDAALGETVLTYDPNGNLLTLTDARTNTTTYTYDSMDRVATRVDPLMRGETYLYDAHGNLREVTDRKNQVTTYTYDPLNRLQSVTYDDASTTTHVYDLGDRLTQIVDSVAGTITRGYDGLDRLTSEATPEGMVSYTYDAADRRATMTVAGQPQVTYGYDTGDRLTSITQNSAAVGMAYDAANRRTLLTLPNGVSVESAYDPASRVSALTYSNQSGTLGDITYTYDPAGSRVAMGGTWGRTGLPQALASATYDAANQILTFGGVPFSYDANGNLTNDGSKTYIWNARDELTGLSGSVAGSFQYDGLRRRRVKTVSGSTIAFLHDGLNIVQELTSGSPSANIVPALGLDEWLTRTDGSGAQHFLTDALGSTVALANSSGSVVTEYTSQPFGETAASGSSSANPFQFTGRENDGTGLMYYRARYFAPTLQRFTSEDPLDLDADDVNLYSYVQNDPASRVDPTGEMALAAWVIPVAIGAATGAGLELGVQLWDSGGNWGSVCWGPVIISGVVGGATASVGPGGPVFGRTRYGVTKSLFNHGNPRYGWSWDGPAIGGRNFFGKHGGVPNTPSHFHNPNMIPGPRGPANAGFGVGGGLIGAAVGHLFGRSSHC
jgi:RHS repeat-associated protein